MRGSERRFENALDPYEETLAAPELAHVMGRGRRQLGWL